MQRILTIDVGNSRAKFGLFELADVGRPGDDLPRCQRLLAAPHDELLPWAELATWLSTEQWPHVTSIMAGVKPARMERLRNEWPQGWPSPRIIREARQLPVEVRLEAPDKVGIDRLLKAVAVNVIRPAATPAIVIDSGTATTVDRLSSDGAFEGGAILPGLELCARSLNEHTAFLPLVPVRELWEPNLPALGRNTPAALRSGLLYGQVGAVRELILRLSAGLPTAPLVVVTGGGGGLLAARLASDVRLEHDLTLQGLALAVTPCE
ncbi:MAG: type III pantothenate kinase [Planctomycetaceae bacterium]